MIQKSNTESRESLRGRGMLNVTALMAIHLPWATFAFLSACNTAKGDD
jgi:hypothetical protein